MARVSIAQQIAGRLEKKLFEMEENTRLPSEQDLADTYDVSKPTIRKALQVLVDKGALKKINGVGIVVTHPPRIITREIVFVCHSIWFFASSINTLATRAMESGYSVSVVPLTGDRKDQERIVNRVIDGAPSGVVVYADPSNLNLKAYQSLQKCDFPNVYIMRLPEKVKSNLVEFGNADGMIKIVKRLYNEGCRRIAFYSGKKSNPAAHFERMEGFLTAMKKCRLKPDESLVIQPDASSKAHEAFLNLFLDETKKPDAVCCLNDQCAGRLIKELLRRGTSLDGVKFSGFDHSPLSEFLPVSILTVNPPMAELGIAAAEILIKQIENPNLSFQRKKLDSTILNTDS